MGLTGAAGMFGLCCVTGTLLTTEPPLAVMIAREREVIIKTTAAIVVSLLKIVAAPRAPKSV